MNTEELQKKFPVFSYDSYTYEVQDGKIAAVFHFSCGEHSLETIDTLSGVTAEMIERIGKEELDSYVFQLGLSEIASYWKAFLSPTVQIQCGFIDETQIKFWQKLFFHGLGEFFYQNRIHPFYPEFISDISLRSEKTSTQSHQSPVTSRQSPVLVPVGGGKDSIVTLEVLAQAGYPIYTWSGHKGASPEVIDLFGTRHPRLGDIIFSRTLDPKLMELNTQGHPNGHTPFSSVLAFFTLLTAKLYDISSIAVSNEGSSNEATGTWEGIAVNHQYSKSAEFEQDFQSYVERTFTKPFPLYFSFLRPLDELAIMRIFVRFPEYFSVFKSCNVGQKENIWCGKCAKCTFVALLLAAYLDDEALHNIFGKDMLADTDLLHHVDALIGKVDFKPFECVGTRSESLRALQLAIEKRKEKLPTLLGQYADAIHEKALIDQTLQVYPSSMPEQFTNTLLASTKEVQ